MRTLICGFFLLAVTVSPLPASAENDGGVSSQLRTASFVTNDVDACIEFYTTLLGYEIIGDATVTAEKSRRVLGAPAGREVKRYVAMAPAGWSIEAYRDGDLRAGVSFIEIEGVAPSPFDQDGERASRAGELVLAHRVTNIDEIARRVAAMNVPIVAPLGKSGSGKSVSMAILDPNGVRIEMYEYK